jgi:hypothetical protein
MAPESDECFFLLVLSEMANCALPYSARLKLASLFAFPSFQHCALLLLQ